MTATQQSRIVPSLIFTLLLAALAAGAQELSPGEKFMGQHRYKEAIAAFREELKSLKGEAAARLQFRIGTALKYLYASDESIAEFEKVLEHKDAPEALRAEAWLRIGQNHQYKTRFDQALDAYRRADEAPGAPPSVRAEARLSAGWTYGKRNETEKSIAALLSVTEVELPRGHRGLHQTALTTAGKLRQKERRYEEAIEYYQRALAVARTGTLADFAENGLIECQTSLTAAPEFYIAPYVSLVSAKEATVFWVSRKGVPAGHLALTADGETRKVEATLKPLADLDDQRQTVRLTGLKPYTLYRYEAHSGERTATGYFHTARDKPGPIRFVVMGDTQTGWRHHQQLAPLIAGENPDFVLHLGDCVDAGEQWEQWKLQMFDAGAPYLQKAPLWVARGNHDGGPYFPILFGRENNPWIGFQFGDLRVLVLESTYSMGVTSGVKQLAWLEEEFRANSGQWTIVTMHHSLFHTATGDTLVGQSNFRPLIEKCSPDFVFNGHYHKYSRQLPIGLPGQKPLINIVSGGAGGGNTTPSTPSPIVEKVYESFHYCVFQLEGDRMAMEAKDIHGQVFDRMTWRKNDGRFQDEVMAKTIAPEIATAIRTIYNDLKFPSYARTDLTGARSLSDGVSLVTLDRNVLDFGKLPPDTMLVIEAAPDTAWKVPRQELNLSRGQLTFEATPPTVTVVGTPLRVMVNVKLGDRLFEPHLFTVTLRDGVAEAKR
jgi:tetratricopeptide (TPR) repeat protein/predicted phosphodiesterase